MRLSKINTKITDEYLKSSVESLYFDRKRGKIKPLDLANTIAAFANANGGVVAVGITDDGKYEGLNTYGEEVINNIQKCVVNFLSPLPLYKTEIINIKNDKGINDIIILFHILPATDYIIRNVKDEVYLRQGDSSVKLNSNQVRSLEYDKNQRNLENEILYESGVEDIDEETLRYYKFLINADDLSNEKVLIAKGFLKNVNNKLHFTKAGMLLFGKNPSFYMPSARVRVVKFEGNTFEVGENYNVIKDKTFDKCLYKVISEAKEFISSQLREFTKLNSDGVFETIPEYPQFCWFEGLVNAITHRDYSNTGEYILIKIFNDRLEISSPGSLGGFVTLDNMKTERYSRNPLISRTLTEFGIVRELNEGVKRIYKEMDNIHLNEPKYSVINNHLVLLVLENNIEVRSKIQSNSMLKKDKIRECWNTLNYQEQKVIQMIYDKGSVTSLDVAILIERGKTTAIKLLNKLQEKDLIVWTGTSKTDCYGNYILKL